MRVVVGVGSVGRTAGPLGFGRALAATSDVVTTLITVTPRRRTDVLLGAAYAVMVHLDADDVLMAASEDAGRLPMVAREVVARSVIRGLIEAAVEERADLVVVGRRRGVAARFGRPLAERLAIRAPCPVVSVPADWAPGRALTTIGVLAEGAASNRAPLRVAAGLAGAANASMRIISAMPFPASVDLARQHDPTVLAPVHRQARRLRDAALQSVDVHVRAHVATRVGRGSRIACQLEDELDSLVVEACRSSLGGSAVARRLSQGRSCPVVFASPDAWMTVPPPSLTTDR